MSDWIKCFTIVKYSNLFYITIVFLKCLTLFTVINLKREAYWLYIVLFGMAINCCWKWYVRGFCQCKLGKNNDSFFFWTNRFSTCVQSKAKIENEKRKQPRCHGNAKGHTTMLKTFLFLFFSLSSHFFASIYCLLTTKRCKQ